METASYAPLMGWSHSRGTWPTDGTWKERGNESGNHTGMRYWKGKQMYTYSGKSLNVRLRDLKLILYIHSQSKSCCDLDYKGAEECSLRSKQTWIEFLFLILITRPWLYCCCFHVPHFSPLQNMDNSNFSCIVVNTKCCNY